jgi:membrane associated rhomboid family serine protease
VGAYDLVDFWGHIGGLLGSYYRVIRYYIKK